MDKKVTIIDFSPRNNGNCGSIAEIITDTYKRTNVRLFKITSENCSPCHDCDYECLQPGKACPFKPQILLDIIDSVCDSDIVYYIVPNFCGFPNANYFAFNERSIGCFDDREKRNQYISVEKRFVIVSNTESEMFANAMQLQTKEPPQMLYLKTGKYKKRSIAGDLMTDEDARAELTAFLI